MTAPRAPIERTHVSDSTTLTIRTTMPASSEALGALTTTIADAGGTLVSSTVVAQRRGQEIRDTRVLTDSGDAVLAAVAAADGVTVDRHWPSVLVGRAGGALGMRTSVPLTQREDLSMAYTPGVARVCMAIHDDFDQAWTYTIKANSIMVVSDGSDVPGAGDVGAEPSLPLCESVALLLREQAGIDAFPLPIDSESTDDLVNAVVKCSSVFAGIHLTGMSAERGDAVEAALKEHLDIPVKRGGEADPAFAGLWRASIQTARTTA